MASTVKARFEYVKRQVDGFEYINRAIRLKRVGMLYQGRCPFHNEKTGSFTVYPAGYNGQLYASFYCFGCAVGGDVIEFKRLQDNLPNYTEALRALEVELGIEAEDTEIQMLLLREQLDVIKNTEGQTLELAEINMVCSSMCRNHLIWVRDGIPEYYIEEAKAIDKFYAYLDVQLLKRNAEEAMELIDELQQRLEKRREHLINNVEV